MSDPIAARPWHDDAVPLEERVRMLLDEMTLDEKLAQLVGYWLDQGGNIVAPLPSDADGPGGVGTTAAPMADEMNAATGTTLSEITRHGLGHLTRVYGTRPVDPAERAAWLWAEQRRLKRETRLGIPALVHEECLTGLAAWKAAVFPTPLAWGASFDHELVERSAAAIGATMRALGIHQGLAPVLDVVRDPRWGRVDECIGEDPYLVGMLGTAYVKGLQSAGVHATLKHFVGYSASQAGRNHAPVHAGSREIADVFLPPFEMAIRDGGVASVMNSYTDVDGIPMASSVEYLTDVLRGGLGFEGVVVADYFAIAFLEVMHAIAVDRGEAAALALRAGIDIELPTGDAYLEPLAERVRSGRIGEEWVDRAVVRALTQKAALGLLDRDVFEDEPPAAIDLDSPETRELAYRLAAESVVLLSNDGILPLRDVDRIAVIGPSADRADVLQGCYSFVNHVLAGFPDVDPGVPMPTVLEGLRAALPHASFATAQGAEIEGDDTSGFADAVAAASGAQVAIVVVGDQAGLFGRGTVGEGNDSESLELPGVQRQLIEAVAATGTPMVLVVLSGRPYAIGWALDGPGPRPAAVLQSFFPGEEGGRAIADLVAGAISPAGRLPVSLPRSAGAQPYSYLHPILGGPSGVTSTDSTPARPFGFGLGYTTFAYSELRVAASEIAAGASFTAEVSVTNTGDRHGVEVVQLYAHDRAASVARPVAQLVGYARVALDPGETARVVFEVPTTRIAFSDRRLVRIVEPGDIEVWAASHAAASVKEADSGDAAGGGITSEKERTAVDIPGIATHRRVVTLTGPVHEVAPDDPRITAVVIDP